MAGDTWEGRVLETLLDKLESVRHALSSDKVFDVIGRLLENVSLRDYMAAALEPATGNETCWISNRPSASPRSIGQ